MLECFVRSLGRTDCGHHGRLGDLRFVASTEAERSLRDARYYSSRSSVLDELTDLTLI